MKRSLILILSFLMTLSAAAAHAAGSGGLDVAPLLGSTIEELCGQCGEEIPETAEGYFLIEGRLSAMEMNGRIVFFSLPMGDTDGRFTVYGLYPGIPMTDVVTRLTDLGWTVDAAGYWLSPDAESKIFIAAEGDKAIAITYSFHDF